jgi:hypothetical protein
MKKPIGVVILAVLAGIAAAIAILRVVQFLGIIPFFFGPFDFGVRYFNLWAALMYGLMAWVYVWLTKMLWDVDPSAWLFLAVITVFNLILDFISMIGAGTFEEVAWSLVFNAIVLIYVMLPGVRSSFGMAKK